MSQPNRRRAVLIFNPDAGQLWNTFDPQLVKTRLEAASIDLTIQPSSSPQDVTLQARRYAEDGYDIVIGAGGDGTINCVIQGLADHYHQAALGILPVGTANVLARELKIPLDYREAIDIITRGKAIPYDLGKADERYFLLMAGTGFDAKVTSAVPTFWKRLFGTFTYFTIGMMVTMAHRPFRVKVTITEPNGHHRVLKRFAYQVIIANSETYANGLVIAESANFDDGILDVYIFNARRVLFDWFLQMLTIVVRKHKQWTDVEHYQAIAVEIESTKPIPCQHDGDTVGQTPISVVVRPKAIQIIAPRDWHETTLEGLSQVATNAS